MISFSISNAKVQKILDTACNHIKDKYTHFTFLTYLFLLFAPAKLDGWQGSGEVIILVVIGIEEEDFLHAKEG